MNLYLISQDKNNGYDTHDSAVVAAKSPSDATKIYPSKFVTHVKDGKWMGTYSGGSKMGAEYVIIPHDWVMYSDRECIEVEYLGKTNRGRGLVMASFNAG